MNFLVITSHPYKGSFNVSLAHNIITVIHEHTHEVLLLDLHSDGFNPVMGSADLRLWSQGKTQDPLVESYIAAIEHADIIIFTFPVWWGMTDALLKGFLDKVLLPDWAYTVGANGEMIAALHNKKALVISTMESSVADFKSQFNDPIDGAFIKNTLEVCGFEIIKHFVIDKIVTSGRSYAEMRMAEILGFVRQLCTDEKKQKEHSV